MESSCTLQLAARPVHWRTPTGYLPPANQANESRGSPALYGRQASESICHRAVFRCGLTRSRRGTRYAKAWLIYRVPKAPDVTGNGLPSVVAATDSTVSVLDHPRPLPACMRLRFLP